MPTKVEVMPGKHWLRIVPQQKLTIGEYALVEIISPSDISESVWDFRVDPATGRQSGVDRADLEAEAAKRFRVTIRAGAGDDGATSALRMRLSRRISSFVCL